MKLCQFWDCHRPIRPKHFLCEEHYAAWQEGLIDRCPKCKRYKDANYELCLDCKNKGPVNRRPVEKMATPPRYDPEHSKTWEKGDVGAERFFVYILKLSNGSFYVGHTRELRERLSEHKDNKQRDTAGFTPKLVYFEILPTREAATSREAELKKLKDSNEREIRRIVLWFSDLAKEMNLE